MFSKCKTTAIIYETFLKDIGLNIRSKEKKFCLIL